MNRSIPILKYPSATYLLTSSRHSGALRNTLYRTLQHPSVRTRWNFSITARSRYLCCSHRNKCTEISMDQSFSSLIFYRGRSARQTLAFVRIFYSDQFGVQVTPFGISVGHGFRRNVIDIDRITRVQIVTNSHMEAFKFVRKILAYPFRCIPRRATENSGHTVAVYLDDGKCYSFSTDNPTELMHAIANASSAVCY